MLIRTMVKIISSEEFVMTTRNNNAVNDERNNVNYINNKSDENDKSTMMKENCNFKLDIVWKDRLIFLFIKRIIIISASRIKKHIGKKELVKAMKNKFMKHIWLFCCFYRFSRIITLFKIFITCPTINIKYYYVFNETKQKWNFFYSTTSKASPWGIKCVKLFNSFIWIFSWNSFHSYERFVEHDIQFTSSRKPVVYINDIAFKRCG